MLLAAALDMSKRSLFMLVTLCACGDPSANNSDAGYVEPDGGTRPPITSKGVSTLAGWTQAGYLDGNRQVNLFSNPVNVFYGPDANVYVADFNNFKVRSVDQNGTTTTTVAVTGFARPFGLTFVGTTLYASTDRDCNGLHDSIENNTQMTGAIWRVDITARTATCLLDQLGRPRGLAALRDGRIAVADYAHHDIRIFDPSSRTITPLAGTRDAAGFADGTGATARFNIPYALVQRADGKLVVADYGNHKLRVVALDGVVTTLAGADAGFADGELASALFNHPQGIAIAQTGELFVADSDNYRIRRIAADGTRITTIAGSGTPGDLDHVDPLQAQFYGLEGLSATPDGKTVFIADGSRGEPNHYHRVRILKL